MLNKWISEYLIYVLIIWCMNEQIKLIKLMYVELLVYTLSIRLEKLTVYLSVYNAE